MERAGLPARAPNPPACGMRSAQGLSQIRPSSPRPQDFPPPPRQRAWPLTALLLITLVEAVGQPVTLPGAGDAPPVATHEVARNVALVGEVVPREQLALCRREGTGRSDGQRWQGATPSLNGLLFDVGHVRQTSGGHPDFPGPQFPHLHNGRTTNPTPGTLRELNGKIWGMAVAGAGHTAGAH